MKFDQEIEKILQECVLNEGVMDFIKGAASGVLKGYRDAIAQAIPKTAGDIRSGIEGYKAGEKSKKEENIKQQQKLTGIAGVAQKFLNEKVKTSSNKRVIINGTPYTFETLIKPTPELTSPKMGEYYIINGKKTKITDQNILGRARIQFNKNSKIKTDLNRAKSILINNDLSTLNLLSDTNLKSEITNFLQEQSEIAKTRNIGEAKESKEKIKKTSTDIDYSKITPEEIIKNLERIMGFYLKTKNRLYFETKLEYLFAFVKDRQVIR